MKIASRIMCGVLLFLISSSEISALKKKTGIQERINGVTVGIISGGIGGTYIRVATDLASVLNKSDKLRILPIVGQGSVQNITDILYLRGIDIGIVQSDVLDYIKSQRLHAKVDHYINYITKLYNEEFHLVAGRAIKSVQDLAGKKVNFGVKGSGTFMTATTVFSKLGVKVTPVQHDQALALEKLKKGEIAATIYVAGKPASAVANLTKEDRLHLVPVEYGKSLQRVYLPTKFTHEDYPALVSDGEDVKSIAVGAVMAVYNWKSDHWRYKKVLRFIEAFFSRFDEFQKPPRHKKWGEVNLAAELPGWKRFKPAEQALAKVLAGNHIQARADFARFLTQTRINQTQQPISSAQREQLFNQFVKWRKRQLQ